MAWPEALPATLVETSAGRWCSAQIDEDGLPVSLNFHSPSQLDRAGAVFFAKVTDVNTVLDMAFLDLGNGKQAMLNNRRARLIKKGRSYSIGDSVSKGDSFLVQVISDTSGIDGKLPSVTPRPKLAGRYVVVESGSARLNFSKDLPPSFVKKMESLLSGLADKAAIIVRGRAQIGDPDAIVSEAEKLVEAVSAGPGKPGLVYSPTPAEQLIWSLDDTENPVYIAGGSTFASLKNICQTAYSEITGRLRLYKGDMPAFETTGINEAIEEALSPRIDLPSGGWISITETEAMTVVDVNMGNAFKTQDAAEAKLHVNQEAALATAFHIQFQNIGGLVVIDFINMTGKDRIRKLMDTLSHALKADSVPVQHTNLSAFGLVEISRPRRGQSLKDRLTVHAPREMRADAVGLDLIKKAEHIAMSAKPGTLIFTASEPVVNWLKGQQFILDMVRETTGRSISFKTGKTAVTIE